MMAALPGRRRPTPARSSVFRAPTLRRALGVEVFAVLICLSAVVAELPPLTVVLCALPFALLPFVVVGGRPLLDWGFTSARYLAGTVPSTGVTTEYIDGDGTAVGVHRRGSMVSCVLELLPTPGAITRLGRSTAVTDSAFDLGDLTESLVQHDISLSRIDIVSHGSRTAPGSPATDVYENLIGPLPAVSARSVWVTVTLDERKNRDAVDARGGGRDGVDRTITIATRRVARALEAGRVRTRTLTRSEIHAAASRMCRGTSFESLTQRWSFAPLPGVIRTGFGIDCRGLDTETLENLWSVPASTSTVVLRMQPSPGVGGVLLSGSCGFVTRSAVPTPSIPRPVSMRGRQREALLTSLPLAITARGYADPVRSIDHDHAAQLRLPTSGCGQLLGSDASGHGVAARIHGTDIGSVHVAGELYLAQQLVFRAVATGARILIRTDRPHAWGPLVDSLATPERLRIDGGPHRTGTRVDLVVHDFSDTMSTPGQVRNDGVTVLTLTEQISRTPMSDPTVSIHQPGAAGDRIRVRTSASEVELVLVTVPQETAFIGRPRSLRRSNSAY